MIAVKVTKGTVTTDVKTEMGTRVPVLTHLKVQDRAIDMIGIVQGISLLGATRHRLHVMSVARQGTTHHKTVLGSS